MVTDDNDFVVFHEGTAHLSTVFFQDFDPFKITCRKLPQKMRTCASGICHMKAQHKQNAKGLK